MRAGIIDIDTQSDPPLSLKPQIKQAGLDVAITADGVDDLRPSPLLVGKGLADGFLALTSG